MTDLVCIEEFLHEPLIKVQPKFMNKGKNQYKWRRELLK